VITWLLSEMSLRFAIWKAELDEALSLKVAAVFAFLPADVLSFDPSPYIVVFILFASLFIVVSRYFRPVVRVLFLLFSSLIVVVTWSAKFGLTFIFLSYILVFISAVLMLFLSIVLMLPALEISYRYDMVFMAFTSSVTAGEIVEDIIDFCWPCIVIW
jgi:hypothetical protein